MKRILKGLTEIKEVTAATTKRVFGVNEDKADKRKAVCDGCSFAIDDEVFGGKMCSGYTEETEPCYCNISTLVYSNKNCILGKWENTQ